MLVMDYFLGDGICQYLKEQTFLSDKSFVFEMNSPNKFLLDKKKRNNYCHSSFKIDAGIGLSSQAGATHVDTMPRILAK